MCVSLQSAMVIEVTCYLLTANPVVRGVNGYLVRVKPGYEGAAETQR